MDEKVTLVRSEGTLQGEEEKRPAEDRLLGMGRLNASDEELERMLARVGAALGSGTLGEQEASRAREEPFALAQDALQGQQRAIAEELQQCVAE